VLRQAVMHRKFACHYRRMLPALLENLQFRSDNRFQPLIEALAIIQKYLHTHYESFPETVPIEGVVTPKWREKVLEKVENEVKVNRGYYELCVLEKLERALKCKEVWVEGSHASLVPPVRRIIYTVFKAFNTLALEQVAPLAVIGWRCDVCPQDQRVTEATQDPVMILKG
jgi:hypothetical protein